MHLSFLGRLAALLALVAIVTGVVILLDQHRTITSLQASNQGLAQALADDQAALQDQADRLKTGNVQANQTTSPGNELARLRSQVASLRGEIAAIPKPAARPAAAPPANDLTSATNSLTNLVTFTGTAHATLVPGQTLVMGGWPLQPGKRALAFFTPERGSADQPGSVLVRGLYLQVPETALAGAGWEQFQGAGQTASASGLFDADQAKKVIETLQKTAGAEILSQPRLATSSGNAGTITVQQSNGVGVDTTLLPVFSPDGQTIDLTVSNSLRRLPEPAGASK